MLPGADKMIGDIVAQWKQGTNGNRWSRTRRLRVEKYGEAQVKTIKIKINLNAETKH